MRLGVLLLLASTSAHADPGLAVSLRHAWVPTDGDTAEWFGAGISLERSPLAYASLRLDVAFDRIYDQCDYGARQVSALAGIRVDIPQAAQPPHMRVYYTAGIGAAALRTIACSDSMASTSARLYAEPLGLGVEFPLHDDFRLRVEGAALVHLTDRDPVALVANAAVVFTL